MIQPPVVQEAHLPPPTRTVALAAPGVSRPVAAIEQAGAGASLRGHQRHTDTQTDGRHGEGHHSRTNPDGSGSGLNGQRLSRALSHLGQLIDVYA
ncbi:MAG TPA: hypothetical protein VKA76_16140 [Gammaproteobacteria bacterium]|nr:hypothetical protein [Gammaproteobacteria bacterium]